MKNSKLSGKLMVRHIANAVTGCRILGSALLLFLPAFSVGFYIVYIVCGFSDMIDGTIARKTNTASEFGEKLDTVADLAFVTVSLIKLFPEINIPEWLWIWGALIAIIKVGNILLGYAFKKQLIFLHTVMNKITGFALFALPLTLSLAELKYTSVAVCSVATFSALQEGFFISTSHKIK